ncbi:hypothetical protein [Lewinella sp. LCG006]|uniref:hypothetical protein n=1 Tax=Lewinella sp. LCG006 TaxID=3231911 RepID=UPI00345F5521
MSKDKGNKNKKKEKATGKKKIVSDYKAEGQKKEPAIDAFTPKSGGKSGGSQKK